MSWYRIYRPQTIAGLQIKPVREALQKILQTGQFSHAYLLTGPKGTGKTSAARILAKVFNCEKNTASIEAAIHPSAKTTKTVPHPLQEPCNTCASCLAITAGASLSVTEIDAASNRGIDDIRSLREQIGLAAPDGLMSIFIIDEVHMLTTEAFNALLKVLEEPPRHVVFLLATTDLQKMPATVLSRCTTIPYRKATVQELSEQLARIATAEQITIDQNVLETIAAAADGSFRDAVKLFEQIAQGKKTIAMSDVELLANVSHARMAADLLSALLHQESTTVATIFETLREKGMDGVAFEREVLSLGHAKIVEFARSNDTRLRKVVALLQAVAVPIEPNLPTAWLPFELACIRYTLPAALEPIPKEQVGAKATPPPQPRKQVSGVHPSLPPQEEKVSAQATPPPQLASVKTPPEPEVPDTSSSPAPTFAVLQEHWPAVLRKIKEKSVPVEGLLKSTRLVGIDGRVVQLESSYQFHKDQLEQARNSVVVEQILQEVLGTPLRFQVIIGVTVMRVIPSTTDLSHLPHGTENLVSAAQEAFL